MHLLLDNQGMYELMCKNDGTYTKGALMATFHDNTWTMVPGIIGRQRGHCYVSLTYVSFLGVSFGASALPDLIRR